MGAVKNSCKTAAVMSLLGKGPAVERDVQVLSEQSRDIETITREILDAKRVGGEAIITIGRGLMEAKALLPHGEWLPWLAEKVEFSEGTAQRFMRLAREWSNPSTLTDLGASKALQLLALPESEREAFLSETHQVGGEEKTVIDMSARELAQAIKERDAARLAAEQAKVNEKAAVEAREKISQDMALANEHIAGLNAEVAEHSAKAKEAQDTAARLEQELAELRSRPVEVAVEADPAAIEAARKEAEAAMQTQVDRVKKAWKKAEEALKASEQAKADAQAELERVKADAKAIQDQAARTEKKAALTANEDLVLFRTLFDQVQEQVNKLGGVLMKFRNKDPEKAQGLAQAMMALSEKIKGVAGQ